jgi:hypothetical protein
MTSAVGLKALAPPRTPSTGATWAAGTMLGSSAPFCTSMPTQGPYRSSWKDVLPCSVPNLFRSHPVPTLFRPLPHSLDHALPLSPGRPCQTQGRSGTKVLQGLQKRYRAEDSWTDVSDCALQGAQFKQFGGQGGLAPAGQMARKVTSAQPNDLAVTREREPGFAQACSNRRISHKSKEVCCTEGHLVHTFGLPSKLPHNATSLAAMPDPLPLCLTPASDSGKYAGPVPTAAPKRDEEDAGAGSEAPATSAVLSPSAGGTRRPPGMPQRHGSARKAAYHAQILPETGRTFGKNFRITLADAAWNGGFAP